MASIQTVLRNKPNARLLYPIDIRITKDRKTSYIFTGQYIDKMQWKKSMRWGNFNLNWARPLKSILAVFDEKSLNLKFNLWI